MKILMSFCNLPSLRQSGVLLAEFPAQACAWIDIGAGSECVLSCTGLWADADRIYCVWLDGGHVAKLSVLDRRSWEVRAVTMLDGVVDPHSVCVFDSALYVVSTGTDEVVRFTLQNDVPRLDRAVWKASHQACDTHHVNGILPVSGRLWCSAFGPKASDRWSSALHGYVVEVPSGAVLAEGIEHPHSLVLGPGDVYVAESRRARARGLRSGVSFDVDGYARGLAFLPDGVALVGVSRGRDRSRSLGTIENPADTGVASGDAALWIFAPSHGDVDAESVVWDLSMYGTEIYDVLLVAG